MHDHIPVIKDKPAFPGLSLDASLLFVFLLGRFENTLGERVQHAVAGAITNDKVIGERCNILDIEKQDVFALFVLQGFDDFMCQFKCVQISPLIFLNGAEYSLV